MMLEDPVGAAIIFQGVRATFDQATLLAVRALIGTPPAGGALGDRLACLCPGNGTKVS